MIETPRPAVVLIGAGHAHLHIASKAAEYVELGARLILIDPGEFWYSGMATGLLGGRYAPESDQVDPGALIRRGGSFIQDRVDAIDVDRKTLTLGSGKSLIYDWLSLNVGSEVDVSGLNPADDGPQVWPVKPIPPLYELRKALEKSMQQRGEMPAVDRVEVTGLRPLPLPHHRTCGFLASGGWRQQRYGYPFATKSDRT